MANSAHATELKYTISFPQPQTHYVSVEMEISGAKSQYIEVQMPVWAPGSYLIREFERNIENFQVKQGNNDVDWQKVDKNTWRIKSSGKGSIKVTYDVYAYELSVRTSFIDADQAYLNGSSIFMYIKGEKNLSSTLVVKKPKQWEKISTSLIPTKHGNDVAFAVPSYDILADAPLQIGNHKEYEFLAAGIVHRMALVGESNMQPGEVMPKLTRIVEKSTAIFEHNPAEHYLFIVHNTAQRGGGLEHLNSTTLMYPRWGYDTEAGLESFLSLAAHEYFHLWNIKRLRPEGLGPFDYTKETYTNLLWVAEGVTSYYDELLLLRAEIVNEERYLQLVAKNITNVENTPGNKVQSVTEASFDAWIKGYRRDENSNNNQISYYSKGMIIAQMLDLNIIHHSKGKYKLDDVMKHLYETIYRKSDKGYTDADVQKAVEKFAGKSMDGFFKKYVSGTETIPYDEYFGYAGLMLVDKKAEAKPEALLGITRATKAGQITVTSVQRGTAAYEAGLNVNDEIVAVNGYRSTDNFDHMMRGRKPGDKVELLLNRSGKMMTIPVTLGESNSHMYDLQPVENPTDMQKSVREKWLAK